MDVLNRSRTLAQLVRENAWPDLTRADGNARYSMR